MGILNIRHWFQKRESAISAVEVAREQMSRYNALLRSDPQDLTRAITAFDCGELAPLARLIEEYERRDDKMKTGSMKMKASVGRCDYSIQKREGFEGDARAERHAEILRRFWSTVRATSMFKRNETGGFNLLKKQMMDAQSYGYAVHELVWRPTADGELRCEFIQVPLWHFENRTGALRFLPTTSSYAGEEMRSGEWMVTTGDGVGIAASLCACMKRMGLVDWMVYNERCGMPLLHGSTGAAYGSEQWNNLNKAIKNIARYTQILTDSSTKVEAIPLGGGSSIPYPQMIEWCDRAIASLYRGADLSTISQGGGGVGATLQGEESDMLEQEACGRLSDTLNEAVERFVIRYVAGDDEPLARIVLEPVSKPNVDTDIKIDQHLVGMGVRLSKNEALQRYGRTEADAGDPEDGALEAGGGGTPPLPNGGGGATALPAGEGGGRGATALPNEAGGGGTPPLPGILEAFARDNGPAAAAIREFLKEPTKEAAEALMGKVGGLLAEEPETAAIIAEAMAAEFGGGGGRGATALPMANAITNPCPKCHRQMTKGGRCTHCEKVAANKIAVDGLVSELDKKGPNGKGKGWKDRTEDLGVLDQKTIDDIKRANPNMAVDGSVATVNVEQLQHAITHHGNAETEAKRGQIAITKDDLRRIPEVLADYDWIDAGKGVGDGKKQESVVFKKSYPDGTVACVELDVYNDRIKKRTLKFQTMWKERK